MAEITAAAVKALREKTGLPMMECKEALTANNGDEAKAIEWLRLKGGVKMAGRSAERETSSGRVVAYSDPKAGVAAMVEVMCESDPVIKNEEFIQLCRDLAEQLAKGPGAATADELLAQPSPSQPGKTLKVQLDDLMNKIREVFRVTRLIRVDSQAGAYSHFTGTDGVLVEVVGDNPQLANDIAMHVAAMRPQVATKADMPADQVEKERALQVEIARKEGKPEGVIGKMIDGRMRVFYEQHVLLEQPFVKEDKKTVAKVAQEGKLEVKKFHHWKLGKA